MEEELQKLLDKQAISEVIWRYCRGMDRMDKELTLSCWHPGGTDDHAPLFKGTAVGFVEWLWPIHAAMAATRHLVSNITVELNGDRAATECAWFVHLRIPRGDDIYDIMGDGRYLDHFEKIGGIWAITHRTSIGCMTRTTKQHPALATMDPPLITPNNPESAAAPWSRDTDDYSYQLFSAIRN
ncbi:nuclear transport factor 2 family protein [Parasphingorhabdus sp.]|uniref:nuclear transport factor 2 family protein n=1 Tax=Parasphingorhabdus sp. TaxID=2709688 RepID=UPI002B27956B|nr:nuclear transport factor 2 family protein [Parasphingorhabdus sp.]